MAEVTVTKIRSKFSEFGADSFSDSVVTDAIATALEIHSHQDEAALWCVAHILALYEQRIARPDGGAGEVTADQTGPRMVSFKAQADAGHGVFFTTTSYGRMFLTLERRSARRGIGFMFA